MRNLFALILLICTLAQLSLQQNEALQLPIEVMELMGSREMRYHHFLWHNIREMWLTLDEETKQAIADLGWAPPRASLSYPADGSAPVAIEDNGSGEDFIYMHRQMIGQVNDILEQVGGPYTKVVGWKSTPAPDSEAYPVPCPYRVPGNNAAFDQIVQDMKTDEFYNDVVVPTERDLKDPEILRTITLGQLGSRLEYTSHKYMHVRFSKKTSIGLREPLYTNPTPDIDEKWDDLRYTWLGDTYSSHVHPWFWKIHGWVEDRVRDWQEANGVEEIQWTEEPWVGGDMQSLSELFVVGQSFQDSRNPVTAEAPDQESGETEDMGDMNMKHHNMERVAQILLKTGRESVLYCPITVPSDSRTHR